MNDKFTVTLSWKTVAVAILVTIIIFAAGFEIWRIEARLKALNMTEQVVVNLLSYNLQQGVLKQLPQAPVQQPAAPASPSPEKKTAEVKGGK